MNITDLAKKYEVKEIISDWTIYPKAHILTDYEKIMNVLVDVGIKAVYGDNTICLEEDEYHDLIFNFTKSGKFIGYGIL